MRHGIAYLVVLSAVLGVNAADGPFRTDGGDDKLPWFQLKPGAFPPPGSAHAISGELIQIDHINRKGQLRPDRDDTQRRADWDIARPFEMLPYGSFWFHGAPAELRDIPIGTHLHGQFYADPRLPVVDSKRKTPPVPDTFTRTIRLEDDFSFHTRHGRAWKVESVLPEEQAILLRGVSRDSKADSKPIAFRFSPATRVWKGRGFGTLEDIAPGQIVQVNLTVCTLKGPGRITDIWLDEESRSAATARQLEVHRQYQREHGLAGWITEVDNKTGLVTATLFDGMDPKLTKEFAKDVLVAAAVAEGNLRTWDQINDVKRGPIVAVDTHTPTNLGDSGVRVTFKPSNLLEGYRPTRIIRLFPGGWKVDDLPREERLYP